MIADVIDTFLKPGNLEDVGVTYLPLMAFVVAGHLTAAITNNRLFHQLWVVVTLLIWALFSVGMYADVFSGR